MTTENNKIIAEFMGYIDNGCSEEGFLINPITNFDEEINDLTFHSDWNRLMQLVEKIEQTTIKETYGQFNEKESNAIVSVVIENKFCQILSNGIYLNEIVSENEETKIEAVYNACIEFIKWYNEQNKV